MVCKYHCGRDLDFDILAIISIFCSLMQDSSPYAASHTSSAKKDNKKRLDFIIVAGIKYLTLEIVIMFALKICLS